jgi:hypothetical protein
MSGYCASDEAKLSKLSETALGRRVAGFDQGGSRYIDSH